MSVKAAIGSKVFEEIFVQRIEMAGLVQDCFSIGSTVACTTCYNQNYEGEVLAFDQQTKMLILSILFKEYFCS